MNDLGTLGGDASVAYAINNSAQIVGYASTAAGANHATMWNNGNPTDLGTNGAAESYARGINNLGMIVGTAGSQNPYSSSAKATLWSGGTTTTLPINSANTDNGSQAYGINDSGQIVGSVNNTTIMHDFPVTWPGGTGLYIALQYVGYGGEAFAINTSNLIAGQDIFSPSFNSATAWSGGIETRLATLSGGANTSAYAVNASGQIVGTDGTLGSPRATLWPSSNAQAVDLNATLRPQVASTVLLNEARGINTAGSIVANGTLVATGATHAYLLTPASAAGAPTAALTASPSAVTVGQSYTLTWSSTNAWACMAGGAGPDGPPWSGVVATSGNQTVMTGPSAGQVTATLSCNFGNQQSAQVQAVISVSYPPLTVSLSASPTSIVSGQSTTLSWTSTNATSCTASGGGVGDGWSGTMQPTTGTAVVTEPVAVASPLAVTFTLTCKSSKTGQSTSASAHITVNPPSNSNESGGGGVTDWWEVLGLGGLLILRLRSPRRFLRQRFTKTFLQTSFVG
jgi:probable HAF family extracellular repeat protein